MSPALPDWLVPALLVVNLLAVGVVLLRSLRVDDARLERALRDELRAARLEAAEAERELRGELRIAQRATADGVGLHLRRLGQAQGERLEAATLEIRRLSEQSSAQLAGLRQGVDAQLAELRLSNERKLEQMRRTVDEQLQGTLERRLGESFRQVSERLEAVHQGLGEMQQLASGVGDLKRVLTNVKTRGTWGEVQLGALLEQVLSPAQFQRNVRPVPESNEVVEFAIRLPGDGLHGPVWLPVDAKFPQEDYQRLVDAAERGDAEAVNRASAALGRAVEVSAADIKSRYLAPPHTTDFAIMYLPTEGLYAEVTRRPELLDRLQREHRVVAAGPTTLAAILNSLQMGFRTLAIEQRSTEVWKVLAAVKTEFGKFGEVLERVKRQLETASRSIDQTGLRSRAIERRLRGVEELPTEDEALALLGLAERDGPPDGRGSREDSGSLT